MKWIFISIASAGLIGLGSITRNKMNTKPNVTVTGSYAPVAVLELFTSEGCSSCPPAEELLPQLVMSDSNIIPLSFHVDYWNRLGWEDPFSSSVYTKRQNAYASRMNLESIYTPQLVVNGEYELVGSNRSNAQTAIKKALEEKSKTEIRISDVTITGDKVSFAALVSGELKKTDLQAALLQKKATMKIKAGENRGATLSHINIVRDFQTKAASSKTMFELTIPEGLTPGSWELIVFSQQTDLKITGATVYTLK